MGFYLILLMGVFTLFESFARPAFVDVLNNQYNLGTTFFTSFDNNNLRSLPTGAYQSRWCHHHHLYIL